MYSSDFRFDLLAIKIKHRSKIALVKTSHLRWTCRGRILTTESLIQRIQGCIINGLSACSRVSHRKVKSVSGPSMFNAWIRNRWGCRENHNLVWTENQPGNTLSTKLSPHPFVRNEPGGWYKLSTGSWSRRWREEVTRGTGRRVDSKAGGHQKRGDKRSVLLLGRQGPSTQCELVRI